jgi:serine/threonine protein kinase
MAGEHSNSPRLLILESDSRTRASVRAFAVKGWKGASVQSNGSSLENLVNDGERLRSFDVILAGCDFSADGTGNNPTLSALRALSADPNVPPVILLTQGGSEYTAVQAMKSGAYDYIPKSLLSREQIVTAVQRALITRGRNPELGAVSGLLQLFGYDIRRCIAKSNNVSVHVAFSAERSKEVVIKVLHRGRGSLARDETFERFVDEFKMLYDVDDPAVAEIYDFRVTNQYCYIAMEFFEEGHLGRKLSAALPAEQALAIATEIAHALSIIHTAGVVHRDLKPGTIMLRSDGTVALIDFGISEGRSRAADSSDESPVISGTPYYMSPEQAQGAQTDERTDFYAFGIILYQMLTGEKPYVGEQREDILDQHCNAPLPQLPEQLARYQPLLDRLLAKSADQRIANARELVELIDELHVGDEPDDYVASASSV